MSAVEVLGAPVAAGGDGAALGALGDGGSGCGGGFRGDGEAGGGGEGAGEAGEDVEDHDGRIVLFSDGYGVGCVSCEFVWRLVCWRG